MCPVGPPWPFIHYAGNPYILDDGLTEGSLVRFEQPIDVLYLLVPSLVGQCSHWWEIQNHATVQSATLNHGVQLIGCRAYGGYRSTSEYKRC